MYDSGSSYDLDVALAHPFSSDAQRKASQEGSSAAARREERKRVKYQARVLPDTSSLSFTPLVFEHFWRWGMAAMDFLNSLARKSRDVKGRKNEADFRGFWQKKFSVILQRCNAKVMLNKLSRLLPQEIDENIYNRDIQGCLH